MIYFVIVFDIIYGILVFLSIKIVLRCLIECSSLEEAFRKEFKMKPLKEPCKSAIREERCLGCNRLENPDFTGDKGCEHICFGKKIKKLKD